MDNIFSKRQSDRAYISDKPVEKEKLEMVLEAARLAPSACNGQPWHIIVVDQEDLKNKVADCTSSKALGMNHFTKQAPIILVIVEEATNVTATLGNWIKRKHYQHLDIGILASHISLCASMNDLGTCIMGWFDEKKMKKLLSIPSNRKIPLVITLGYPSAPLREKKRKEMQEIVSYNKY